MVALKTSKYSCDHCLGRVYFSNDEFYNLTPNQVKILQNICFWYFLIFFRRVKKRIWRAQEIIQELVTCKVDSKKLANDFLKLRNKTNQLNPSKHLPVKSQNQKQKKMWKKFKVSNKCTQVYINKIQ